MADTGSMISGPTMLSPQGQGTAGVTDLVTALQGVVRQFSNSNQNMLNLIAAVAGAFPHSVSSYTVATLPASPSFGSIAAVTDGAAALAWGATISGGGTAKYLIWWNAAHWTVIGK